MFVVLCSPCGFSSITVRRCASGPASASSCTSWPKRWRDTAERDRHDQIAIFTSSWKDRPAPALASEMPSVRIVDVKVPVRALVWAWNRLEWPPVEWLAGSHDVVHSQSPLLIPATRAAQVVTVHDLDFLRHPDQMSAEIRRDYPALARSHAARAHAVIVSSQYAAGEVTRELQLDPSRVHVCPPGRPAWADEVRSASRAASRGKHILFMGTLSLRKNVGTLLEAYARLRAKLPDAPPLVLAGHRTPASARWEARCEQPPLQGPRRRSPATWTARARSICMRMR